jgi:hypothetical protein
MPEIPILSAQEQEWLQAGISQFDAGRFWHAHEDWEALWKSLKAADANQFYIKAIQGVIQCAALLFQVERENPRGIANMWSKITDKLGHPGAERLDDLWGIDISALLAALDPFVEDAAVEKPTWSLEAQSVKIVFRGT